MELLANSNGGELSEILSKEAGGSLATLDSDLLGGDNDIVAAAQITAPSLPPIINGSLTDCLTFNGDMEEEDGGKEEKEKEEERTCGDEPVLVEGGGGGGGHITISINDLLASEEFENGKTLASDINLIPDETIKAEVTPLRGAEREEEVKEVKPDEENAVEGETENVVSMLAPPTTSEDVISLIAPPTVGGVGEGVALLVVPPTIGEGVALIATPTIEEGVASLIAPPTISSVGVAHEDEEPDDEEEEMEIQSEHNEILQQSSTSKESDLSGDSHLMSGDSNLISLSDPELSSQLPTTSSLLVNDQLDVHDSLQNVKDLPHHEEDKEAIPTPSGVASFSLSSVNIPDNALNAPVNMLTRNFPRRHRHVHRAAVYAMHPYHRATCRGGAGVNVAKTLELLKAVLQTSFNQELKKLCDDYLHIFSVAAANINDNTSDTIPDSTLKLLVTKMLEEAQQGYQNGKWEFPSVQLPKNDRVSDSKGPPMSTKKVRSEKESRHYATSKRRKISEKAVDSSRSAWRWSLDKRRLNPGKWSIDKLNSDTLFVLGVNVNKALGHAANRGKVYILHPELFKYVCDGDDKTWLYDNKHLPVHGGKAFLLIYDEVESLVRTEDSYKDNVDIFKSVQKLQRFSVPQFMEKKMKDFVRNVQGYFAQESAAAAAAALASANSHENDGDK